MPTKSRRKPVKPPPRGRIGLRNAAAQSLAKRLKEWYQDRYRTQAEFAEKLGIPSSTVAGWFGKAPKAPDPARLLELARAGLSLDWLFTGEGSPLRGASRAPAEIAELLREHLVAAVRQDLGATDGSRAEDLVPTSKPLLARVTRRYVRAARVRLAESRKARLIQDVLPVLERDTLGAGRAQLRLRLELARQVRPLLRELAADERDAKILWRTGLLPRRRKSR